MKNPTYEQYLAKQGVDWHYEEKVDLSEVDAAKGLRNQARLIQPLDEDLVTAYAAAMKDGDQFPPLVLWRPGRGRYTPLDGNQRLASYHKLGRKAADAYVVETKDEQAANRIAWTINNHVNGRRLLPEECLEHAVTFARTYGRPVKEAAAEWGVPAWKVIERVAAEEVRDIVGRDRVAKYPALKTDRNLHYLSRLRSAGDDLLVKATLLAGESGLGTTQVEELVDRVKAARTAEARAAALDEFATSEVVKVSRGETKGGRVQRPRPLPRGRLASQIAELARLLEQFPDEALRPAGGEFKVVREEALEVTARLTTIFGLGTVPRRREGVG